MSTTPSDSTVHESPRVDVLPSYAPGDMAGLDNLAGHDVPSIVRVRSRRGGPRAYRAVSTGEGVDVVLPVAPVWARVKAWLLDMLLVTVAIFGVAAVGGIIGAFGLPGVGMSVGIIGAFVVRHFYFVIFETLWHGRTPGKKNSNLRVVDRNGKPLNVEQVFVRNVTRDLEIFLPIVVLLAPRTLFPNAPGWGLLLSGLWLVVFLLFPLFNRERLRVGDLIAGTMVVPTGRGATLLEDPAIGALMRVRNERPVFTFSPEQLEMYGIFELQVLEDVLRQDGVHPTDPRTLEKIAKRVQRKIGYSHDGEDRPDDWQFLHDFYAALRARHERRVMLGQRQPFKKPGQHAPTITSRFVISHHSGRLPAITPPATAETPPSSPGESSQGGQ